MGYAPAQAVRRIMAMETALEDANVTGYEKLVSSCISSGTTVC